MDNSKSNAFDNLAILIRDEKCLISTVLPPYRSVYWPNWRALLSEMEFPNAFRSLIGNCGKELEAFFSKLSPHLPQGERFQIRKVDFKPLIGEMRTLQTYRSTHLNVFFNGSCSLEMIFALLEGATTILRKGAKLQVSFNHWDVLKDWTMGRQFLLDVMHYLSSQMRVDFGVTCASFLTIIPEDFWSFMYDHTRIRLKWTAEALADCTSLEQFEHWRNASIPWRNLLNLANQGICLQIVLPATQANVSFIPEIARLIHQETRGGALDIIPAPFLRWENPYAPPDIQIFTDSLMAILASTLIPLQQIFPLSWIADRINAETPLINSAAAAGAEVAVMANGDLYAGECSIGLEEWRLGNVLQDKRNIKWERLDAMPEVFSHHSKPARCKTCEWRYRCGGVDCSAQMLCVRHGLPADHTENPFFELYCRPRKMLFEEMLWNSVEIAVQDDSTRIPEMLELSENGIQYQAKPSQEALTP